MLNDPAKTFWNNKKIVEKFASDKPSKYLLSFFKRIKKYDRKKVLDIGCGGGRNVEMLLCLGFDVYGCDLNSAMVRCTKKRVLNLKGKSAKNIISASMSALPYPDNLFSFVVSNGVLHNAKNFKEFNLAIYEISRVLKSNGYLILNTFIESNLRDEFIKQEKDKYLYFTKKGLATVLLPTDKLIKILSKNNLQMLSYQIRYKIIMTGKRKIFKGIFEKKEIF